MCHYWNIYFQIVPNTYSHKEVGDKEDQTHNSCSHPHFDEILLAFKV